MSLPFELTVADADDLLLAAVGVAPGRAQLERAHLLCTSHAPAVSILKTNNRPEWTGCHPNLTKMKTAARGWTARRHGIGSTLVIAGPRVSACSAADDCCPAAVCLY